jgi:eukaryotic-like serine/threonine-protein kinase
MSDSSENKVSPSSALLRPGEVIGGRYRVESLLGRGGMGVVYGAIHELTQRRVALKLVDSEGADQAALHERFLSEARTAAAVRHPNVVDVLDMGVHGGSPYLVMELLEGRSLDALLDEKQPLSLEQVLAWIFPVIGALASLHEAGIVHRDVKPSNIFLSHSGRGRPTVAPKLLDFGLARALSDARLTRSGVVLGTPLYMAPEHAAGGQVGPPADVWSLGVVLFECVTGALPFTTTDRSALAAQILAGHVRSVRQARADVPPALAAVIDTALQRDLRVRHASMRAFAQALVRAAVASHVAVPDNPDPLGLPDFPAWRAASGGGLAIPAGPTTTQALAGQRSHHPEAAARRPSRGLVRGLLALVLALGAALAFYRWQKASPPAMPAPAAAEPPAIAPAAPTSTEVAPEPGPQVEPELRPPDAAAPRLAPAEEGPPPRARRTPAERRRRKPGPEQAPATRAPKPPAEVETEWK